MRGNENSIVIILGLSLSARRNQVQPDGGVRRGIAEDPCNGEKDLALPGLPPRRVIAAIVDCWTNLHSSRQRRICEDEDSESTKVDSAVVNDYIREFTRDDFTAKDFRTWHGTGHMPQQLAALGPAQSETEAKRNITQAVKETAKHLGNPSAACRKYYVHPAVFHSYVEKTIFPAMQKIHSSGSKHAKGLGPVEVAVPGWFNPAERTAECAPSGRVYRECPSQDAPGLDSRDGPRFALASLDRNREGKNAYRSPHSLHASRADRAGTTVGVARGHHSIDRDRSAAAPRI
jgi:hypothetical protein